ncbi:MAG: hypothetical protein U0931_09975 [Vulcanimicrobiota bacterium]
MAHWQSLSLEQLPTWAGPWRLVSALPWLKSIPALRQAVLGQRAVAALPQGGSPLLMLRLPRSRVDLGGQRFSAEQAPGSKAWVVALELEGEQSEQFPSPPAGAAQLIWGEAGWPEVHWRHCRLASACSPWARDWAWAWIPTAGPVCLRIYLRRERAAISDWLQSRCPGVWVPHGDGYLSSSLSEDCRMNLADNYLELSRGYLRPTPLQVESDYLMLLAMSEGALGELQFDLLDGDYYCVLAAGESARSLRDYLHARARAGKKHRWNRFPQWEPIDARAANPGESLARLAEAFGWDAGSLEQLEARLAGLSLASTPRHLTVLVSPQGWDQQLFARLAAAQPRIVFSWRLTEIGPLPARQWGQTLSFLVAGN